MLVSPFSRKVPRLSRIDPSSLPPQFDSRPAEDKWDAVWQKNGTYRFAESGESPRFVIDTPPPTVSGSLHVGHVFSYTQIGRAHV